MAIEHRRLGRPGAMVSNLCLGTMNFGWKTQEEGSFRIVDRALELGINFFDTADVYGLDAFRGVAEQIAGRWLAQGGGKGGNAHMHRHRTSVLPVGLILAAALTGRAENAVTAGNLVLGPPTLICLGYRWSIAGDDNLNAAAASGSARWARWRGATACSSPAPSRRSASR